VRVTYVIRQIPLLSGTTLPDGQDLGYYVDSSGKIVVLTKILGTIGLVKKANVTVAESGRRTPTAGTGRFGDPTRNHSGPPVLKRVGTITPTRGSNGVYHLPLTFHVDEQAAVYVEVYHPNGDPFWIVREGTSIRGARYTGWPVHTMHLVINRPGLIRTQIQLPRDSLVAGETYKIRVTAVDFDGHKVTTFTTFTR
jgi:hypothetical protein